MAKAEDKVDRVSTLAAELFEHIAKAASARALRSLRLTSRQCAVKVLKTYAKANFSEVPRKITIDIHDDSSIAKCLRICKHAAFGPAVRTLVIVIDKCQRYKVGHVPRWCRVDHRHAVRGATLSRNSNQMLSWLGLDAEINRWLDGHDDWEALHMLFNELHTLCQRLSTLRIVAGKDQFARHYRLEHRDPWQQWACASPVVFIMRCLDRSHLKLSTLEIGTETETDAEWGLPIAQLTTHDLQLLGRVMSSMRTLKVSLWTDRPTGPTIPVDVFSDTEALMVLQRSFAASNTLEHLSINSKFHHRSESGSFVDWSTLHFQKLEPLHWGGCFGFHCQVTELASFINAHKSTLKHVALGKLAMCNRGITKAQFEEGVAASPRRPHRSRCDFREGRNRRRLADAVETSVC